MLTPQQQAQVAAGTHIQGTDGKLVDISRIGDVGIQGPQGIMGAVTPAVTPANSGGLGDYATYNGIGISQGAANAMMGTDHGGTLTVNPQTETTMDKALGYGGLAMQGAGIAGNLYFANENLKAQKDFTNWQKGRVAESDARKAKFAQGVGGSY